jgi:Tfp pilus assembly protein PilE
MMKISRRGIGILELLVAGILLGTLMTLCLEFFGAVAGQRRALQQRQAATQEVANVMERIAARPWESLTTERLKEVPFSEEAKAQLPEAQMEIDVATPADDPTAKRVTVSVQWQNAAGELVRPVRLVAWRYQTTSI